ncbi:MAG: hypothetical protein OTJ45_05470, partial [Alphaproteobacteria bacterium]|nr:hypothetical protein [Alphaproteobacteria bacterium]
MKVALAFVAGLIFAIASAQPAGVAIDDFYAAGSVRVLPKPKPVTSDMGPRSSRSFASHGFPIVL